MKLRSWSCASANGWPNHSTWPSANTPFAYEVITRACGACRAAASKPTRWSARKTSSSSRNVIHVPVAASRPAFAAAARGSRCDEGTKRIACRPQAAGGGGCAAPQAATSTTSAVTSSWAAIDASAASSVGRAMLRTTTLTCGDMRGAAVRLRRPRADQG